MIRKSKGGGFEVRSHTGKRLTKPGMSKAAAQKRLGQIEFFKHHKGAGVRHAKHTRRKA